MNKMRKTFGVIGNIIFYPFFAAMLAILIAFLLGINPYIVMSGSMEPTIQTGSLCFVDTKADYNEIKEGDIIAYKLSGSIITHRAIAITDEGIETKGDNNAASDGITTKPSNFHGQTIFHVPYVGYAINFIRQPRNVLLILVTIAVFTGVSHFLYDADEDNVRRKKKEESDGQNEVV